MRRWKLLWLLLKLNHQFLLTNYNICRLEIFLPIYSLTVPMAKLARVVPAGVCTWQRRPGRTSSVLRFPSLQVQPCFMGQHCTPTMSVRSRLLGQLSSGYWSMFRQIPQYAFALIANTLLMSYKVFGHRRSTWLLSIGLAGNYRRFVQRGSHCVALGPRTFW